MNIVRIPLDQIDTNRRLRPVDPDEASLIGANLALHGQLTPIEVRSTPKAKRPYALIAGAHRVAGAIEIGWTEIAATIFAGSSDEAELREIDENLIRHELKELDRATFLVRRKELHEKLYPHTKHGGERTAGQVSIFGHLPQRFTAETAEKLGLSETSIKRILTRARIDPTAREEIAGLWIADHGSQLDALVKLPPGVQQQVARTLQRFPAIRSVAAAIAQIEGRQAPAPDPAADQFDAFIRLWKRMPGPVRARVRAHIALPEGTH